MTTELRFRRPRGETVVRVKVRTPTGVTWVPTGQTSYQRAREVCTIAMVQRLQLAASAEALTAEVISRLLVGRRVTCTDVHDAWHKEVAVDLAPDTLNRYSTTVRQLFASLGCENKSLTSIHRPDLAKFVNEPRTSASLRRSRLAAARAFYKFASAAGFAVGNLADRITVRTRDLFIFELETKETLPITPEEYRTLMSSPKCVLFYRWATALGYLLGLRFRDIACLEWESIREDSVLVWQQKTGRRLELPLDDPMLGQGELRQIIAEMRARPVLDPRFCFPEQRALALDPKRRAGLSVRFQRVLARCGIKGKRFHSTRHAFACRLKAAGRTIEEIAERLGHAGTSATPTYTEHQ